MTLPRQPMQRARRQMAGAGLIEVLVAVVILAFGMLGIAALQAATLRNSQSALERGQATMQMYAILDAMRANVSVARIGGYNLPTMTCALPDAGDLAANDLRNWIGALKDSLGAQACGKIVCGGTECTVSVQWDDSRGSNVGAADSIKVVSTRTRI